MTRSGGPFAVFFCQVLTQDSRKVFGRKPSDIEVPAVGSIDPDGICASASSIARFEINNTRLDAGVVFGARYPLPQKIVDARFKAALLFVIANFLPVLD
jgi:hypothetical protein